MVFRHHLADRNNPEDSQAVKHYQIGNPGDMLNKSTCGISPKTGEIMKIFG